MLLQLSILSTREQLGMPSHTKENETLKLKCSMVRKKKKKIRACRHIACKSIPDLVFII